MTLQFGINGLFKSFSLVGVAGDPVNSLIDVYYQNQGHEAYAKYLAGIASAYQDSTLDKIVEKGKKARPTAVNVLSSEHVKHFNSLEEFYKDTLKSDGVQKTKQYHTDLIEQLNKLKRRCYVTIDA